MFRSFRSISAKIVADSTTPLGGRLTTFVLRYHRYVHAELMTHRAFSRNASSSRAIPVKTMINWTMTDPAIPVEWGKNQGGMQARETISREDAAKAEAIWLEARDKMIASTEELIKLGIHKQIANRLLEPWHYITVIVTATQFANWFGLRFHPDAQPEIERLSVLMLRAYRQSTPKVLVPGEWHLPFVYEEEKATLDLTTQIKCSVARSARVSRLNHDGSNPIIAKDIELHDDLVVRRPLHASPAEHQATPLAEGESAARFSGNFGGTWKQYRKTLTDECIHTIPDELGAEFDDPIVSD